MRNSISIYLHLPSFGLYMPASWTGRPNKMPKIKKCYFLHPNFFQNTYHIFLLIIIPKIPPIPCSGTCHFYNFNIPKFKFQNQFVFFIFRNFEIHFLEFKFRKSNYIVSKFKYWNTILLDFVICSWLSKCYKIAESYLLKYFLYSRNLISEYKCVKVESFRKYICVLLETWFKNTFILSSRINFPKVHRYNSGISFKRIQISHICIPELSFRKV